MSRPDDVSLGVWKAAEVVAKEATRDAMRDPLMPYYITVAPHIARAITAAVAAEREACAVVAENRDPHWPDDGDHIASAIRARSAS